MQYMLLIYENEKIYGPEKSGPLMQQVVAKHMAFNRELGSARIGGAGLKATATATTVRTSNSRQTIHDGPFAETKEQLGGYYLVEVPDLNAALEIAKKLPLLSDGCVEVRPLPGP